MSFDREYRKNLLVTALGYEPLTCKDLGLAFAKHFANMYGLENIQSFKSAVITNHFPDEWSVTFGLQAIHVPHHHPFRTEFFMFRDFFGLMGWVDCNDAIPLCTTSIQNSITPAMRELHPELAKSFDGYLAWSKLKEVQNYTYITKHIHEHKFVEESSDDQYV